MAATEKVSITIGQSELRGAKVLASRLGVSLSTFITAAVRERIEEQARREAAEAVLATFTPAERATPDEQAELLRRWSARPKRTASRKRRST